MKNKNVLYLSPSLDEWKPTMKGSNLLCASNRSEAQTKINEQEINCVISPLSSEEQQGLELLKQMRRESKNIPFVFIVAPKDNKHKIRALQYGVSRFIEPSNRDQIPEYIESIFTPQNEEGQLKRILNLFGFTKKFFKSE